jgi:hypothetical protein
MRYLLVTVDTEIDRDRHWRIADPATFSSVTEGIPEKLSPIFARHGVRPTFLVSAEVLENPEAVTALRSTKNSEIGTHLHPEFVEPMRLVTTGTMAGMRENTIQSQYPPEVERAKLANITQLFREQIGRSPSSFRAGRYGMSSHTLEFLAELGYEVDSSVTPGILWTYPEGVVDYRSWDAGARTVRTPAGNILELPITIEPSRLVTLAGRVPFGAAMASRLAALASPHRWLRPSRSSGKDLIRIAQRSELRFNVMMFHSVEIIPTRSPYAATSEDVDRILSALGQLFAWWAQAGNAFCTMQEAATLMRGDQAA